MMDILKSWGMSIAGAAILSAIFEMFMPEGDIKKYVRTALGLVLVCIIVKPLNEDLKDIFQGIELFQENYQHNTINLEDKNKKEIAKVYTKKLSCEIEKSIKEKLGNYDIEITPNIEMENGENFGKILDVQVCVKKNDDAIKTNERLIKEIVHNKFGVPYDKVKLKKLR